MTTAPAEHGTASDTGDVDVHQVFDRWLTMWNDNPALAEQVVSPVLTTHLPQVGMPPPGHVCDPPSMAAWITAFRGSFDRGRFHPDVGPFAVGDLVICRWRFTGVWRGGRPAAATAPAGTPVDFYGVDILRLEHGRVAEYWLTDDQLDLYAQLGAVPTDRPPDRPAGGRSPSSPGARDAAVPS